MIGRVCMEITEVAGIIRAGILVDARPRIAKPVIAEHIEQWTEARGNSVQIRPRSDRDTDQQPGIRASHDSELARGCVAGIDEPLSRGEEIIESILSLLSFRCFVP